MYHSFADRAGGYVPLSASFYPIVSAALLYFYVKLLTDGYQDKASVQEAAVTAPVPTVQTAFSRWFGV